jgi:hypothetical protein
VTDGASRCACSTECSGVTTFAVTQPEQLTIDEELETFDEWVRRLPTGDDDQDAEESELATVDFSTPLATMGEEGRAASPVGSGERAMPPTVGPPPCISSVVDSYPFRGSAVA